jgi:ribosome-binding protein aMBF1 (putative translation factor)
MFCLHGEDIKTEARPPTPDRGNTAAPRVDLWGRKKKTAEVDFATRFGQNLARYRVAVGLSQEELGVRASLHRTAVGQLERGERVPRADTVVKLAGSLAIRPEMLLEGLEWTPGGTRVGQLTVNDN